MAKATTLEDLVAKLDGVVGSVNDLTSVVTRLTLSQADLGKRFETQENLLLAMHSDIKELYDRIDQLRVDAKHMSANERQRLAELEAFAMQVAEKTGIPFNLKSKRRS